MMRLRRGCILRVVRFTNPSNPVGTLIHQDIEACAITESVSAQIMYDAAQGGYAASLCAYTPSSIETVTEGLTSMTMRSETLNSQSVTEDCTSGMTVMSSSTPTITDMDQTKLTPHSGTVSLSPSSTRSVRPPLLISKLKERIIDTKHIKQIQRATDKLTSGEEREREIADDDDSEHEDNPNNRSATLVFRAPEILGHMWDKASRAGRLDVI